MRLASGVEYRRLAVACGFVAVVLLLSAASHAADCNVNGVNDGTDISSATSQDCNSNGVPDECDVFPVSLIPGPGSPLGVGSVPVALAAADFDGEGSEDLVVVSSPILDGYAAIFLQDGAALFSNPLCGPLQTGKSPESVAAADFDVDGDIDVAVTYGGGFAEIGGVEILLNLGFGGCISDTAASPFVGPFRPNSVVAAKFDGDADVDLAVTSANGFWILLNDGSGNFTAVPGSPFMEDLHLDALDAGDMDGDGDTDLVLVDLSPDAPGSGVLVGWNDGTGQFLLVSHFPQAKLPSDVKLADVDNDGDLDAVVSNAATNDLSVLIRRPMSFAVEMTVPVGQSPEGMALADFDGDGNVDIAVANSAGNNLTVLMGPSFTEKKNFDTGTEPVAVVAADFDGDADPDVAVVNRSSNTATILLTSGPRSQDANNNGVPDECQRVCGFGAVPMLPVGIAGMIGMRLAWVRRRRIR